MTEPDLPYYDTSGFARLAAAEDWLFWFTARNRLICWALRRHFPTMRSFCEIGCGTGATLRAVQHHFPGLALTGIDYFPEGLVWARARVPQATLMFGDIHALPATTWIGGSPRLGYRPGIFPTHGYPLRLGGLEMWFSYRTGRGTPYQIGYASSDDGNNWDFRPDKSGINISPAGWDSEMIEYPFVFDHEGDRFLIYNGNGFGKTGFGLAILEK